MSSDLRQPLSSWDTKATQPLIDLYQAAAHTDSWLSQLAALCRDPECERAATWLLKHHLETGGRGLPEDLIGTHLQDLPKLRHWEAQLHGLQYLERLTWPDTARDAVHEFIGSAISSDNKLVRAWGYYTFAVFAEHYPDARQDVADYLEKAHETEKAASIKVRLRKAFERLGV